MGLTLPHACKPREQHGMHVMPCVPLALRHPQGLPPGMRQHVECPAPGHAPACGGHRSRAGHSIWSAPTRGQAPAFGVHCPRGQAGSIWRALPARAGRRTHLLCQPVERSLSLHQAVAKLIILLALGLASQLLGSHLQSLRGSHTGLGRSFDDVCAAGPSVHRPVFPRSPAPASTPPPPLPPTQTHHRRLGSSRTWRMTLALQPG